MAQLPTITVSDEQAQELLDVFGSADNYKAWLKQQLLVAVKKSRRTAAVQAAYAQADVDFSDIVPEDPAV